MKDLEKWKKMSENIPVPDSLKPEQIEPLLWQKKKERQAKHSRMRIRIASLAACLLILLAVGNAFLHPNLTPGEEPTTSGCELPASQQSGDGFVEEKAEHTTYAALYSTISDYLAPDMKSSLFDSDASASSKNLAETEDRLYESVAKDSTAGSQSSPAKTKSSDTDFTKTNVQVDGVDEGDVVKTDGSYIYHCSDNDSIYGTTLKIYRADGANTKEVAELTIDNYDIQELYLAENRLIAVGSSWKTEITDVGAEAERPEDSSTVSKAKKDILYPESQQTGIFIYDISDAANPVLLTQKTQSGQYHTSRKNGNYLYTLSTMFVYKTADDKQKKYYVPATNGCVIPEDHLYLPENVYSNCYLVLTALDITKEEDFTDKLSVLGGGDICYVSENHIYVASPSSGDNTRTSLSKYRYDNGKLEALAVRTFKGQLHNQFSMDEYNGYLRFVATTYKIDGSSSNGLYVLDKNLYPVGSVDKLAKNERIYSARFMGNHAYFVTYRETDPVFVVDLTDPKNPVVKDKLKIPGFSEYLHSYGDNLLLGIGSNETKDGDMQVKLSMFDITRDTAIKELHKKLLETDTESTVGSNHKAILVDQERNRIGFSVESFDTKQDEYDCTYRIYSYDKKGFHQIARLKQKNLTLNARGLFIGNCFYLIDNGISVYDAETWKEI